MLLLELISRLKLFFELKLRAKIHKKTVQFQNFLNTIKIKYGIWNVYHTRPFTKLNYNSLLTYLLLAIIFFVPIFFFVFTTLQLFGIEYNSIKVLNVCYEFFTNILKFLENNINNFNNQETTMSFKNENSTSNNAMLEANLTSNSKVDKGVDEVKELNLKSENTNTSTNSTTSDDTKKSNPLAFLNNKYVIATFIGGLVIGAVCLINPDLPATCFRGLKNLFWKNNGIPNVLEDGLKELKELNNAMDNPLEPRADILDQGLLINLNGGLVNDLADAVNKLEGKRELVDGVLEAACNPNLFNVVNDAVELQNLVPPHVATTLALVIPFAIGIFSSSLLLSPELRQLFTQNLSNINLNNIQWKPDIISMLNPKTYMFRDVQVINLRVGGFRVEDLRVDGITYNNFHNELEFPRFNIYRIDFEALTMSNISFKNLKFDTITFDRLYFDVQAFWLRLTQTEYYFAFKDLSYKEVLAILTLGLVISALSSHMSSFGVYPSPFYGNGCRYLTEVQQRHDPRYLEVLEEYAKLETFKIYSESSLTQIDSGILEAISETQEVHKLRLLSRYLHEEITSMENTAERLEQELRVLRDRNSPPELIESQIEKMDQLSNLLGNYLAADRRLKRRGIWPHSR